MSDTKPVKAPTQANLQVTEMILRQMREWMKAKDSAVELVGVYIDSDCVTVVWHDAKTPDTRGIINGQSLNAAFLQAQHLIVHGTLETIPPF